MDSKKMLVMTARAFAGSLLALPLFVFAACTGASCNATSTQNTTFTQNLYVNGAVAKGSGSFVIDHPLDPKNKLLFHSFVESPDMKNIYDGIATFDEKGEATILLPRYFLALNRDFRYLATGVGAPAPSVHLKAGVKKGFLGIGDPRFTLAGGTPGAKVSWQVTGIRHDPFANAYRVVPEVDKDESGLIQPGEYVSPELYDE